MKKKSKKTSNSTVFLLVALILGLSLLLYPSVSNWWNSFHSSRAISNYNETIANMDDKEYQEVWAAAEEYNKRLVGKTGKYSLSEQELEEYNSILNVSGTGVMGYIEIPSLKVSLPIYHGTEDSVLQIAAGHINWSSLPVGGESTHCVLSGHRGLPSAKLFTDIDELVEGDVFMLNILSTTLTYEVDQILIVEPENVDDLQIENGMDYCTLVTCTPYGINTHRLLVRGHRIENLIDINTRVSSEAMQIEPLLIASIIAVVILLILLIIVLVKNRKPKIPKREEIKEESPKRNVPERKKKLAPRHTFMHNKQRSRIKGKRDTNIQETVISPKANESSEIDEVIEQLDRILGDDRYDK